jgi:hypothetical protein
VETDVLRVVAMVVMLLAGWSSAAQAQSGGAVAIGLGINMRGAPDESADGTIRPSFIWRIGHGNNGWGWRWGLNWYSADLSDPASTRATDFGTLRVRPIMIGYGYERRFGRLLVGGGMVGGYALTQFRMTPEFNDAYRAQLGATTVRTDVSNTFVVRPEMSAWIDLSRKVGLSISSGYVIARPEVTVSSSLGTDRRRIQADMFSIRIGAVYSIF